MEIFVLVLFSFLLRVIFILSPTSDKDMNLWTIQKCGYNKFGEHWVKDCIFPATYSYAWFNHWMFSLFPRKYQVAAAYLGNIGYDVLLVVFFYALGNYCLIEQYQFTDILGISPGFIVALLYSTSPVLFPYTARLKGIGARVFGNVIVTLYLICLYFAVSAELPVLAYVGMFVCILFSVIGSQFSTQALVFISVGIVIYYQELLSTLVIILSFCACYFLNIFGSKATLKQRLDHYQWYIRNQGNLSYINNRSLLLGLLQFPVYLVFNRKKAKALFFHDSTLIILAYSAPQLFWLAFHYQDLLGIPMNPLTEFLFVVMVSGVVIFALTSTKWLLFLGQAERYIEFILFPICLFFFMLVMQSEKLNIAVGIVFINIAFIIVNFLYSTMDKYWPELMDQTNSEFHQVVQYLDKLGSKSHVVTLPTKKAFDFANYVKNKNVFYYFPCLSKEDGNRGNKHDYHEEDEADTYLLKLDFSAHQQKYQFNYIVLDKSDLSDYWLNAYTLSLSHAEFETVLDNKLFTVYRT